MNCSNLLTAGTSPYRSAVYETQTVNVYGNVVVTTGLETVVPAQGAQAGQNGNAGSPTFGKNQVASGS